MSRAIARSLFIARSVESGRIERGRARKSVSRWRAYDRLDRWWWCLLLLRCFLGHAWQLRFDRRHVEPIFILDLILSIGRRIGPSVSRLSKPRGILGPKSVGNLVLGKGLLRGRRRLLRPDQGPLGCILGRHHTKGATTTSGFRALLPRQRAAPCRGECGFRLRLGRRLVLLGRRGRVRHGVGGCSSFLAVGAAGGFGGVFLGCWCG